MALFTASSLTRSAFTITLTALLALTSLACGRANVNLPPRASAPKVTTPKTSRLCAGRRVQSMAELAAASHCAVIDGDLVIHGTNLESLAALSRLRVVLGQLEIAHNPRLKSLDGLEGVTRVGHLSAHHNLRLATLDGLDGLVQLRRLTLTDNARLISVRALSRVEQLESIEMRNNPRLYSGTEEFFPRLASVERLLLEGNASISPREERVFLERTGATKTTASELHVSR